MQPAPRQHRSRTGDKCSETANTGRRNNAIWDIPQIGLACLARLSFGLENAMTGSTTGSGADAPYIEWINLGLKKPGKTKGGLAAALNVDPTIVRRITKGLRRIRAGELGTISRYIEEPVPIPPSATPIQHSGENPITDAKISSAPPHDENDSDLRYVTKIRGSYYWSPTRKMKQYGFRHIPLGERLTAPVLQKVRTNNEEWDYTRKLIEVPPPSGDPLPRVKDLDTSVGPRLVPPHQAAHYLGLTPARFVRVLHALAPLGFPHPVDIIGNYDLRHIDRWLERCCFSSSDAGTFEPREADA